MFSEKPNVEIEEYQSNLMDPNSDAALECVLEQSFAARHVSNGPSLAALTPSLLSV